MKENIVGYIAIIIAVTVVVWVISSITGMNTHSEQNFQQYETQRQNSGSECGNLNDLGNIRHLSHHPDMFADCIKQVDDKKFLEAVGQNKEDYLKSKGIE